MSWRSALRDIRRLHPGPWETGERLYIEYSAQGDPGDVWFAHFELERRGFPTAADYMRPPREGRDFQDTININLGDDDPAVPAWVMKPPTRSQPKIDVSELDDIELRCYYVVLGAFYDDTLRWMLKGAPEAVARSRNDLEALDAIIPIYACMDAYLARKSFIHGLLRGKVK